MESKFRFSTIRVHLAINDIDNKEYAIKILDKNKIIYENLNDNIKSEVETLKLITHPYIVKLIEVMAANKKILLVMEYINGGDLFDAISILYYKILEAEQLKRIPEKIARIYFQQIIMAVDYCHKLNILHRDLKPENILLDKKTNCIKVSDFGLAQIIKSKDEIILDVAGTTSYLAPEVIKQTGYTGQSADIWSTGVILFNLVTGAFPFYGKEDNGVLINILSGNVKYPEYLSKGLIDLLSKIFVVNPNYRYNIEQIITHPWFRIDFENIQSFLISNNCYRIETLNTLSDYRYLSGMKKLTGKSFDDNFKKSEIIKKLVVDLDRLPIVTCFELVSMISGNYIENMFEKNKNNKMNFEKNNFKFVIKTSFDSSLKVIFNFFCHEHDHFSLFKCLENDKYLITVKKDKLNAQIFFMMKKVSNNKFIFIYNYKEVIYI